MLGDGLADDVQDARDQRFFRHGAIGEGGVVGDIDEMRVGTRLGDLAEDGEAAEAGVEDEDRRTGGSHG